MMINPATGWFEIIEVLEFDLDKVMSRNDECIDNSYTRLIQLFKYTCLSRYLHPRKFMFENGYEFKRYFTHFLRDLYIKPVYMTVKNSEANAPV